MERERESQGESERKRERESGGRERERERGVLNITTFHFLVSVRHSLIQKGFCKPDTQNAKTLDSLACKLVNTGILKT